MATKRTRVFRRDAHLSIRLPEADKDRLREVARRAKRDASNLALALICRGLDDFEKQLNPNFNPATHGVTYGPAVV